MKLSSRKITSEITLYYSNTEPDCDLVKNAGQIFDGSVEPFKTLTRHAVYYLNHNTTEYYAKKFFSTTLEQKLSYLFRGSKALRCLNISNQLLLSNFKIIETAFILNYHKNFRHESIWVTKKAKGINIKGFLNSDVDDSKKEEVLICLLSTLGAFFKKGFFHHDPLLQNFIIDQNKRPCEIIFLDYDSISYWPWLSDKHVFYNLNKLNYSIYLTSQNNENLYSPKKVLFYLNIFLKSYNPKVNIDDAYKYLTQGTIKLLKRKKTTTSKVFLSKIVESNL